MDQQGRELRLVNEGAGTALGKKAFRDTSQGSYGGEGAKMKNLQVGVGGRRQSVGNYHIYTAYIKV